MRGGNRAVALRGSAFGFAPQGDGERLDTRLRSREVFALRGLQFPLTNEGSGAPTGAWGTSAPLRGPVTQARRRLRDALRPITPDARLSALHHGILGIRSRAGCPLDASVVGVTVCDLLASARSGGGRVSGASRVRGYEPRAQDTASRSDSGSSPETPSTNGIATTIGEGERMSNFMPLPCVQCVDSGNAEDGLSAETSIVVSAQLCPQVCSACGDGRPACRTHSLRDTVMGFAITRRRRASTRLWLNPSSELPDLLP
jgi:hypothetical protein